MAIFSALTFSQLYKTLCRARDKNDSNRGDGKNSETNEVEGKKKAVLEVGGVLLHHSGEVGNVLSSNFSCRARHDCVYEEAVQFRRTELLYGNVLSHASYDRHDNVLTGHLWWTNEMEGFLHHSPTEKIYAATTEGNEGEVSSACPCRAEKPWMDGHPRQKDL